MVGCVGGEPGPSYSIKGVNLTVESIVASLAYTLCDELKDEILFLREKKKKNARNRMAIIYYQRV